MEKMFRSKTFWAGIAAILSAAGGYFTGTLDPGTALQTAFTGLIGIFLRAGIAKGN